MDDKGEIDNKTDKKDKRECNQIKTDQSIPSFFIRFEKLELYV